MTTIAQAYGLIPIVNGQWKGGQMAHAAMIACQDAMGSEGKLGMRSRGGQHIPSRTRKTT